MALIRCSNCNHEISDTVDKCIHCGTKIQKQVPMQNEIRHTKNEENIKNKKTKVETVKIEIPKKIETTPKNEGVAKPLKVKKEHMPRKLSYKKIIFGIVFVALIASIPFISIKTYSWFKEKNRTNLEDNQQSNTTRDLPTLKNLNTILAPKVTHNQEIQNNDILLNIEVENGKSAIYTIDVENTNNIDVTLINMNKNFVCNGGTSYTCFESIEYSWQDNNDSNIIKANTTRTMYLKILTTGKEENGIMDIRLSLNFKAVENNNSDNNNDNINYTSNIDNAILLIKDDCLHCKNLQPIIENMANKFNFALSIIDYDIDDAKNENGEIVYPTLLLYRYDKLALRYEGFVTEDELIKILKDNDLIKE